MFESRLAGLIAKCLRAWQYFERFGEISSVRSQLVKVDVISIDSQNHSQNFVSKMKIDFGNAWSHPSL